MMVVLPAPFGPMSAWIVPASTLKEASRTALTPPNAREIERSSSDAPRLAASSCVAVWRALTSGAAALRPGLRRNMPMTPLGRKYRVSRMKLP